MFTVLPPPPKNPKNQTFEKINKCWIYHHFRCAFHKPQSYEIQFLRYRVRRTEFFVILDHFSNFYDPNNPENQNFEKLKKEYGGTIILHRCTKNRNYMMYVSWDMKCDRYRFLSFWANFCPFFTPLLTPKIKIWKKCKTYLEILSFYTCVP